MKYLILIGSLLFSTMCFADIKEEYANNQVKVSLFINAKIIDNTIAALIKRLYDNKCY